MKKQTWLFLLGYLLSSASWADWSPTFTSGYYQGTVVYNGSSRSVNETMTSNG